MTINDHPVDALHTGQKTGYQDRHLEIICHGIHHALAQIIGDLLDLLFIGLPRHMIKGFNAPVDPGKNGFGIIQTFSG